MTWHVYALREPASNAIRYVGRSKNPARRLVFHMRSSTGASGVRAWCASLAGSPVVEILSSFENETLALLGEQEWIAKLRDSGADLLNATPGGEIGGRPRSLRHQGFGERTRARREELGLTITALARLASMGRRSIYRMEGGETPGISADCAVDLARALNCSVEWLVTGEERPQWRNQEIADQFQAELTEKRRRARAARASDHSRCSLCKQYGHNKRTCSVSRKAA